MAERDGERTKQSILAAADELFARHGFNGTSMQQIGEAAGVARSTPAYFFRSKQALYDAVLTRAIARAQEAMAHAYAKDETNSSTEDTFESYVGALLDFLGHDRTFVRLIQREALTDETRVPGFFDQLLDDAITALTPAAEQAGTSPQRLALDVIALCWLPFAHERTLMPALGMNARDPAFLDEQKRHLGDLTRSMAHRDRREPTKRDTAFIDAGV